MSRSRTPFADALVRVLLDHRFGGDPSTQQIMRELVNRCRAIHAAADEAADIGVVRQRAVVSSTRTRAVPPFIPNARFAAGDRSMMRPFTCGPLSEILTTIDRPLSMSVTRTIDPNRRDR